MAIQEGNTVAEGMVVAMHYTLTGDDGKVIDSSSGGQPLYYLHGAGNIVSGLERQLTGKNVGEKITAVVPPEEARRRGSWRDERSPSASRVTTSRQSRSWTTTVREAS